MYLKMDYDNLGIWEDALEMSRELWQPLLILLERFSFAIQTNENRGVETKGEWTNEIV